MGEGVPMGSWRLNPGVGDDFVSVPSIREGEGGGEGGLLHVCCVSVDCRRDQSGGEGDEVSGSRHVQRSETSFGESRARCVCRSWDDFASRTSTF